MATIGSSSVMGAVYTLHRRLGRWPSAKEIAGYLEVDRTAVAPLLADLRDRRLFRDRQRSGIKVWMPWEES